MKAAWKQTVASMVLLSMMLGMNDGGLSVGASAEARDRDAGGSVAADFADISGHWAAAGIQQAIEKGYVDGYEDGTFRPDRDVTRAEFGKMLVTARGGQVAGGGVDWYSAYVKVLEEEGVYREGDFGEGGWNDPIRRDELAVMSLRAAGKGTQTFVSSKERGAENREEEIYWATKAGLMQGLGGKELGLDKATTRAQSVTIIERVLDVLEGKELPVDKYAVSEAEIGWHRTNVYTMLPGYFRDAINFDKKFGYSNLNRENWMRVEGKTETAVGYCEVEKFVVVDMDDPNDPNRGLIGDGWKWRFRDANNMTERRDDTPTNSFALINITRLNVELKEDIRPFHTCGANIRSKHYDPTGKLQAEGKVWQDTAYSPFDEESKSYANAAFIDLLARKHNVLHITGEALPKGKLAGDDKIVIANEAAGSLGDRRVRILLESRLNVPEK